MAKQEVEFMPGPVEFCRHGHGYQIGEWPFCRGAAFGGDHSAIARGRDPFEPYFDAHIIEGGEFITSRGHRDAICRERKLERG